MATRDEFQPFDVWLPSFLKAETQKDGRIWVKGIATTGKKDLQGEDVNLSGLDWDYAVENGAWFDTDHDPSPEAGRGRLTKVVPQYHYTDPVDGKRKVGAYVEGYLYPTKENEALRDLLEAMDNVGDKDGIGLSIRGPIQARSKDGKTIAKGVVRSIAITRQPVNTDTRLGLLSKSLATAQKSLDAGDIAPSTSGGSGAALLRQDLSRKPTRSNPMKRSKKEWFDALPEEQRKALVKSGYSAEDEGEGEKDEDEQDDLEKSLKDNDEMSKALDTLGEHLARGAGILVVEKDGTTSAKVEGIDEMSKALATTLKGVNALVEDNRALRAGLDELCKAMNRPALPRAVRNAGEPVAKPNPADGDSLSVQEASSLVMGEFNKALEKGDSQRATELRALNAAIGVNGPGARVLRGDLMKRLGQ